MEGEGYAPQARFSVNGREVQPQQLARLQQFARVDRWGASSRWPNAAFSSVEAVGAGYLGRLAQWLRPSAAARTSA